MILYLDKYMLVNKTAVIMTTVYTLQKCQNPELQSPKKI